MRAPIALVSLTLVKSIPENTNIYTKQCRFTEGLPFTINELFEYLSVLLDARECANKHINGYFRNLGHKLIMTHSQFIALTS